MVKSHEQDNQLSEKISIWETIQVDSNTDILTKAVLHSVLYVANEIEHERAVLLPDVSKIFLKYLATSEGTSEKENVLESPKKKIYNSMLSIARSLIVLKF